MMRLPLLLVTFGSLVASNAWALRLGSGNLQKDLEATDADGGEGQDQFARRLPHFRTWDSDIFFNTIDCSTDSGSWTAMSGNGDGEKVSISWSSGSNLCSFSGSISVKASAVSGSWTRRNLREEEGGNSGRRLEDASWYMFEWVGNIGYINNARDALLLSGTLTDSAGTSKSGVLLLSLSSSSRRERRLEDAIGRNFDLAWDARLQVDSAADLIRALSTTDGSELTSPNYSTYLDPSTSDSPSSSPTGAACFPEPTTAQVKGVGPVAMKDLRVGDLVLTSVNINKRVFEPVYAFGHRNPKRVIEFVQLVTHDSTLEMSGEHMVFVANKANPVRADSIQVGDVLQPAAKVVKINTVRRRGLYAPLTPSGQLVVDDILASSYVSLQEKQAEYVAVGSFNTGISQHGFAHLMLSPYRAVCVGMLGISSNNNLCHAHTEDGLPHFVGTGFDFQHWAEAQNLVLQWVLFATALMIAGVCMFLEGLFGQGPIPVVVAGAAFVFLKANRLAIRANKVKSV